MARPHNCWANAENKNLGARHRVCENRVPRTILCRPRRSERVSIPNGCTLLNSRSCDQTIIYVFYLREQQYLRTIIVVDACQ